MSTWLNVAQYDTGVDEANKCVQLNKYCYLSSYDAQISLFKCKFAQQGAPKSNLIIHPDIVREFLYLQECVHTDTQTDWYDMAPYRTAPWCLCHVLTSKTTQKLIRINEKRVPEKKKNSERKLKTDGKMCRTTDRWRSAWQIWVTKVSWRSRSCVSSSRQTPR